MTYLPIDSFLNGEAAKNGRRPRGIITIDDVPVKWIEAEISTGSLFYVAGSYRITLPLNQQPNEFDLNFWVDIDRFTVKIYVGFPTDPDAYNIEDLTLLMVGDNNEVDIDPLSAMVYINGRDLTSRLIDSKITQTFSNMTASQLAIQFAEENGLTPEVVPTSNLIGNYAQTGQTFIGDNTTQWDMLVEVAQNANFVVYVDGETLIFKPRPEDDGSIEPFVLEYSPPNSESASPSFNGMDLRFGLNNIISGNVSVTIKVPFSYQQGNSFSVTERSHNANTRRRGGRTVTTRKYVYVMPGLTQEQAVNKAKSILGDLTIHGAKVSAVIPGNSELRKDSLIKITGTNSALDQIYYPDEITRNITFNGGYEIRLTAKNNQKGAEISDSPEEDDTDDDEL